MLIDSFDKKICKWKFRDQKLSNECKSLHGIWARKSILLNGIDTLSGAVTLSKLLSSFWKGSTSKEKNLLPRGANSFFLKYTPFKCIYFSSRHIFFMCSKRKQKVAKLISCKKWLNTTWYIQFPKIARDLKKEILSDIFEIHFAPLFRNEWPFEKLIYHMMWLLVSG